MGFRRSNRLEGMFAIAIWDASTQSLLLARDRLGIKPLYYALTKEGVVFASEPKTILASGWIKPELCTSALPDFFMFRAPVGPVTLFEGIKKLSAGCWARFDRVSGMGPEQRYWEPRADEDPAREIMRLSKNALRRPSATPPSRISRLMFQLVSSSLEASTQVYSRLLSRNIQRSRRSPSARTASSMKAALRPKSRIISDCPLHVRWVTGDDFRSRFDDWCFFNDDPVADPSALALMLLAEHARLKGMKVMLAGEGADELFGGYDSYVRYKVYSFLARNGFARYGDALRRVPAPAIDRDYLGSLSEPEILWLGARDAGQRSTFALQRKTPRCS